MAGPGAVTPAALAGWLREFACLVDGHADELTALDAAIGDGDHGVNLRRGLTAVVASLDAASPDAGAPVPDAGAPVPDAGVPTSPADLLKRAGMTIVSTVGGASGPLYGTFLLRMASAAGDAPALEATGFAAALRAGLDGVVARGRARPGDKTMVDALTPACDALQHALDDGAGLGDALARAAAAAAAGRDATVPLIARKGRASYLGERSAGHTDPGAASAALLVTAAATALR